MEILEYSRNFVEILRKLDKNFRTLYGNDFIDNSRNLFVKVKESPQKLKYFGGFIDTL